MVFSSLNIQYQRTRDDSLHSLGTIELRQSIWVLFLWQYGDFWWRARIKYFGGDSNKVYFRGACKRKINQIKQYSQYNVFKHKILNFRVHIVKICSYCILFFMWINLLLLLLRKWVLLGTLFWCCGSFSRGFEKAECQYFYFHPPEIF